MKTLIISYSFSGNNAMLSEGLSQKLKADRYQVIEMKKRNLVTIVWDVIFNRTPKIENTLPLLEAYTQLILVAPVWMGMAASPMRNVFKQISTCDTPYSFVSFSAGADGENPKLADDLEKRTGRKPLFLVNPLIREIHPKAEKASRRELDAYRLAAPESTQIINQVYKAIAPIVKPTTK